MTELAETFRAMREASKAKRAFNREASAQRLRDAEIPFTSHNAGSHLIIQLPESRIDFWPGTGLWRTNVGLQGRGVRNLIAFIQEDYRP